MRAAAVELGLFEEPDGYFKEEQGKAETHERVAPRPGQLRSFARHAPVRVIPRISSRGVLCGAVFRVASAGDLGGAAGAAH